MAVPKPGDVREIRVKDGCIICKTCEFLAPTLFVVPENELSSTPLKKQPEGGDELESLKEAMRMCPVHVISFRRDLPTPRRRAAAAETPREQPPPPRRPARKTPWAVAAIAGVLDRLAHLRD
ncbi:MAG: ferredoxin [Myxococcales bacterium]|nr:ferredoxin [Myxococcales bacterium]